MTTPSGYVYHSAGYYAADGSGPYQFDGSEMSLAQRVYEASPAGFFPQFGRVGAGPIWSKKLVTSDATGLDIASGPAIFGGLVLVSATGVVAQVYDGITATGDPLVIPALAATFIPGCGVLCDLGITVDWTSGSWLVLYAPQTGG